MKNHFWLLILLALLSACRCDPLRDKLVVVEAGKTQNAIMDFEQWESVDGMLEGRKINNMLYAAARIDSGKWEVKASLQLRKDGETLSAAFLELGGNRLYLDQRESTERLWVVGNDLKDSLKFEPEQISAAFQKDTIRLEVRGDDEKISVWLDGDSLSAMSLSQPIRGKVGFYAHRGQLRIRDFRITAHLSKLPFGTAPGKVFERGEAGVNTFRIPSVCAIGDSVLLAFCEGRLHSRSDFGAIDIRMRRSTDGGQTWGPQEVLSHGEKGEEIDFNNPSVVYDPGADRVHFLYSRERKTVWYRSSTDQGVTWSDPVQVLDTAGRSLFPGQGFGVPCPGHGIRLTGGDYAGRLIFPVFISFLDEEKRPVGDSLYSSVIYSDDTGRTWQAGGRIEGLPGPNEHQIAELPGGRLISTVRLYEPDQRLRGVSFSSDGGKSWTELAYVDELMDPACHASIRSEGSLLYFSNPANHEHYNRSRLVLRISPDEGTTWGPEVVLWDQAAAYSDLVLLEGGRRLGCLFEFGYHYNYESIVLWSWDLDSLKQVGLENPPAQ